jgi:hypothetical protein
VQWLTLVILAIQEAEIQRLVVPGQLRERVSKTPSQQKKLGVTACACHLSYKKHK